MVFFFYTAKMLSFAIPNDASLSFGILSRSLWNISNFYEILYERAMESCTVQLPGFFFSLPLYNRYLSQQLYEIEFGYLVSRHVNAYFVARENVELIFDTNQHLMCMFLAHDATLWANLVNINQIMLKHFTVAAMQRAISR